MAAGLEHVRPTVEAIELAARAPPFLQEQFKAYLVLGNITLSVCVCCIYTVRVPFLLAGHLGAVTTFSEKVNAQN